ncbi:MAG: hypothetical protein IPP17_17665 [Bacteroidetes bacterium]|nr:hypothetical protein [Bacteroidota bacterium]
MAFGTTAFVPILVKPQEQQLQIDVLTLQTKRPLPRMHKSRHIIQFELESLKAEVARIHQTLPLLNASNHK